MALLTEEQIQDLYLQLDNVSSTSAMQKVIQEWNEKQPSTQFEPDWSIAPEHAESAVLKSYWIGEGTYAFGQTVAQYDRPAPVITPHPHAEIMAKYAEVAARRVDPWVEFERFSHCDMEWDGLPYHPDWTQGQTYRHIGEKK